MVSVKESEGCSRHRVPNSFELPNSVYRDVPANQNRGKVNFSYLMRFFRFSLPDVSPRVPSVRDGWGISDEKESNIICDADTTNMAKEHIRLSRVSCHGLAVCLSDDLMSNSEVG